MHRCNYVFLLRIKYWGRSSFHISNEREKKTLSSAPLPPSIVKKKKEINQGAPFPPSHNEYNINPSPSKQ
jgi:hypothetical protein